jgi:hypothetical protein
LLQFTRFGIANDSDYLVVGKFDCTEADLADLQTLVDGRSIPVEELKKGPTDSDLKQIKCVKSFAHLVTHSFLLPVSKEALQSQ